MSVFQCKMCGGALDVEENMTVCFCAYCGTKQTLPRLTNDKKQNMYERAGHYRRSNEFDKAIEIYEKILDEDPSDSEAYWSLVLCRYGIEYVEDPATKKRVPTVNRAQFTSIFSDEDYKAAIANADASQRAVYEAEAQAIDDIQKGILAVSEKEDPFDVFICYKETDSSSRRTPDSVLANDLYHQLTQEGFKVFFARITLEDKIGTAYEPYIFAALNSAKVMVVIGTKPEYFNAVWVKNEWSRYLALIKAGANKVLVPAYRDMDPYDLPDEFSYLQAQDMSKLGFMQDLIRGINKIAKTPEPEKPAASAPTNTANSAVTPLLKRVSIFLEDGEWSSANEYCEKVLDIDPECADAYLGKLMAELKVSTEDKLSTLNYDFANNVNYKRAVRYGCVRIESLSRRFTMPEKKEEKSAAAAKLTQKEKSAAAAKLTQAVSAAAKSCNIPIHINYAASLVQAVSAAAKAPSDAPSLKKRNLFTPTTIACTKGEVSFHRTFSVRQNGSLCISNGMSDTFDMINWRNVVSIACGNSFALAVTYDRKVLFKSFDTKLNKDIKAAAASWSDIAAVSACNNTAMALTSRGTAVCCTTFKEIESQVAGWKDICKIAAGSYHCVGLKKDGTVVVTMDENVNHYDLVPEWNDIIAIDAGTEFTVGLHSDGTVVAKGKNDHGQCNVSEWKDIIAISAGNDHVVGLKSDGTVVTAGNTAAKSLDKRNTYNKCDVAKWSDIAAIAAGQDVTIGMKKDGTFVFAGDPKSFETYSSDKEWWGDTVQPNDYATYDDMMDAARKRIDDMVLRHTRMEPKFRAGRLCQHCGGRFTGMFTKKCTICGLPKDY